ncbi:MAG: transcriptional regulator, partial [Pseudomonadota bacterium]
DTDPISQSALGERVIGPLWEETREAMLARLEAVTMEDLCRRAGGLEIPHGTKPAPDFNI